MLEIKNIQTGYGKKQVLFDVSLTINAGEIVAVIGPNGAGKSTVLKAAFNLLPVWAGDIRYNGKSINGRNPADNIKNGITFCPQGKMVFDELSVMENLEIGGLHLKKDEFKTRLAEVLDVFPLLQNKLKQNAGKLSGGEQQMLALGRALITKPRLLMLDEPSLGLAPNLVKDAFDRIAQFNTELGVTVLIVEQKVREVLAISHRAYGIKLGKVAYEGNAKELEIDKRRLKELFL